MQQISYRARLGLMALLFLGAGLPFSLAQEPKDKPKEETRYEINFSGQPWPVVFTWLTEVTKKPILSVYKPQGTVQIVTPKGAKYTVPQIIDLLNEAMVQEKHILLQRKNSFTLLPADKEINPNDVGRASDVKDLDNYGETEVVNIVVPLKSLVAADVQIQLNRLKGKFGSVVAIDDANQLVLTDQVKNLRLLIDTIERIESSDTENAESFSHKCKYIKATKAERILKELLGDPARMMEAIARASRDRRDPRGGGSSTPMPTIRMHYISSDEEKNIVLVTGPANIIAKAKTIVNKIDVSQDGQLPYLGGAATIQTYTVQTGSAEAVAQTLQEAHKESPSIRISAVGASQIMVYGYPEDQLKIAKEIKSGISPSSTQLISVGSLDATKVSETLNAMFLGTATDDKTAQPLYIAPQEDSNSVIVRGTQEQIAQVKEAVDTISGTRGVGGSPSTSRIITLEKGSAATLAEALKQLLPQMRRNPVRIISPNRPGEQPGGGDRRPMPMRPSSGPQSNKGSKKNNHYVFFQDEKPTPEQEKLPGKADAPIRLAAFGNRLVITCSDPKALSLAQEVARLILQAPATDGDFKVIPLKHASATEAARVLDEAFNGPRASVSRTGNSNFFDRFRRQDAQIPTNPRPERIRVVGDPVSNSLLVKASPLDMLTIQKLLEKAIDSGKTISKASLKTWYLGPLKYAHATDVARVMKDVYRAYTRTDPQPRDISGFNGFSLRTGFARQPAEPAPQKSNAALWIGVDERTNSLAMYCSELMYEQVKELVKQMEAGAKDARSIVKVVPLMGANASTVQRALEAIQGKTSPATTPRTGGVTPPIIPSGRLPARNGNRSRSNPGGLNFFERGVKEDPKASLLTDPQMIARKSYPPLGTLGSEEASQPPPMGGRDVVAPRSDVIAQALEELGIVVIRTNNPEDAKLVQEIIKILVEQAKQAEVEIKLIELKFADPVSIANLLSQVFQRVNVGPGGNSTTLTPPSQTTTQSSIFGSSVQSIPQPASVGIIPIPRFNALLIATARNRMEYVEKEINRLDKPTSEKVHARPFQLKKAAASRVAQLLRNFYAERYPTETTAQNQIRFTYDDSSNTVFVQAAPADMADIARIIEHIDTSVTKAVNDIVIVPLRNAVADEMANILMQAITKGVVFPTVPVPGATGGAAGAQGGVPGAAGQIGQQPGAQIGQQPGGQFGQAGGQIGQQAGQLGTVAQVPGVTTKTTGLRFIGFDKEGRPLPPVESGVLEDVQITPDVRINSLIISAPEKSMNLLLKLIDALDVPPQARAEINIFPLKNADAATIATLLQQLFLGTGAAGQQQPPGPGGAAGVGAGATGQVRPLQLSVGGQTPEGAPLIDLRITADPRTNSVIVAGSVNDLDVVEAIISRLEDSTAPARQFHVYHLKNSTAADVAQAVNQFLAESLQVLTDAQFLDAFQRLQRQVVVVPEPISNKLLISATPRYFDRIVAMIQELDAEAPQVVIQVLVAEVDLTGNEEFGVEFGLQSPVLFQRGLDLGAGALTGLVNGNVVQGEVGNVGTTNIISQSGFNFANSQLPLPNSQLISPGNVGLSGLGSLGVGRISSTSGFGGFVFSAQSNAVNVLVRALKAQGRIDILSRPQLMTLDNQAARILIGQDFPFVTNIVLNNVAAQQGVDYRPVGVQLQVIPKITPDGRVIMRVIPEVSSVAQPLVPLGNGQLAPAFNVQTVETTVSVIDGETVVLGGLITKAEVKNENKVPLLGDLPGVGWMFRFRTHQKTKQELMVILTPHIVRNRFEADVILAQESRRMDWILGDIVKTHGTTGLEPILTPPGPGAEGLPPGVVPPGAVMPHGMPHGMPQGNGIVPHLPGHSGREVIPAPSAPKIRSIPNPKPLPQALPGGEPSGGRGVEPRGSNGEESQSMIPPPPRPGSGMAPTLGMATMPGKSPAPVMVPSFGAEPPIESQGEREMTNRRMPIMSGTGRSKDLRDAPAPSAMPGRAVSQKLERKPVAPSGAGKESRRWRYPYQDR